MKYITTDKHPELKEGLILEFAENKSCLLLNYTGFYLEVGITVQAVYQMIKRKVS